MQNLAVILLFHTANILKTDIVVSGGLSPFWAGNRYRTMAKVLRNYIISNLDKKKLDL